MKRKHTTTAWDRLVAAARSAPLDTGENVEAPFGFSTRVAARALSAERAAAPSLFVRFAWPALGVAALITAATVTTNLKPVMDANDEDVAALSEPVVVTDTGDVSA
ncbi:MAG TPA: hypothetical protein VFT72_19980 [Opitutaceae bacterium]|nr:hypothetical protein [Opitutaceae bacterium]